MAKTIENLFRILHYSADLLVVVTFLILFVVKRIRNVYLGLIALYASADLTLNILDKHFSGNIGLYVWSTFTFFEYSIFTYIIWAQVNKKLIRQIILVVSFLFIVFTTIHNFVTNFKSIDSIPIGIETILILIYSFYYLYEQTNDPSNLFIYSKYTFWLITGFLIYLAGSFFIYIFASGMDQDLLTQYWYFTNGFYTIMNVFFLISFFIYAKAQKSPKKYNYKLRPSLN